MSKFSYVLSSVTPVSRGELRSILGGIHFGQSEFWAVGDRNNFLHTFCYNPQQHNFTRSNSFEAHDGWISGFAFMKPCDRYPEGALISCSHDHTVKVWHPETLTQLKMTENTPILTLIHDGQVCFVDTIDDNSGRIISCSWDSTCRIWTDNSTCIVLKHEQFAIWGASYIPNIGFVTCGADKTIRLWTEDGEMKFKLDNAHNDVIRGSKYIGSRNILVTISNDGSIFEWQINGLSLTKIGSINVSDQYLYSIALLDDSTYIASSEDRCAYVASSASQSVVDVLPLPDIVWSADVMDNGDIVCASADGCVRSFSQDPDRRCDKETEDNYLARLSALTFSNPEFQQINPLDLPLISSLTEESACSGRAQLVRSGKEMVVCLWSNGYNRWLEIGKVVIATDGQQKNRVADSKGQVWDYCFDVQLEDGRNFPLYLNHDTNEYTAAYNFMNEHELDKHYLYQIVEFIQKNRKKTTIDTSSKPAVFPLLTPNYYCECNPGPVVGKLKTLNNNDPILSDLQFTLLEKPLCIPQFGLIEEVVLKWPQDQSWPILDILRSRITEASARQAIPANRLCGLVNHVASADNPPELLVLMLMRVIGNIFKNYSAEALDTLNLTHIFTRFSTMYPTLQPRTQVAFATALLNYSAFIQGNSALANSLMDILIDILSSPMDEGALHRVLYAAGNSAVFSAEALQKLQLHPELIEMIRSKPLSDDVTQAVNAIVDLIG